MVLELAWLCLPRGVPCAVPIVITPDTWQFGIGTEKSVKEILATFNRNRAFYRNGGITATGGEPLAQPEFIGALFEAAHNDPQGRIHTCLDSSGIAYNPETPENLSAFLITLI